MNFFNENVPSICTLFAAKNMQIVVKKLKVQNEILFSWVD